MRILLISNDADLIESAESLKRGTEDSFDLHLENGSSDPLDVMSLVCNTNPSILIVDDDFLRPHSAHILKSIKRVKKNIEILFITSDSSLELGREIIRVGIQYYAIKPIEQNNFNEMVRSIRKLKMKALY